MVTERDLLRACLTPEAAGWAEFEKELLARTADCFPTGELIEFAEGTVGAGTATRIRLHLPGCPHCSSWVSAYRDALSSEETEILVPSPSGSLMEAFASRHVNPPRTGGLSNMVLTGFATMFLAGRTREALDLLQPHLPDILEAVGLDPALSDRLRKFIRDRVERDEKLASSPFPQLLRTFAREELQRQALDEPASEDWQPVLVRGAFRTVQSAATEGPVRDFLQTALDRGLSEPAGLELLRLEEDVYANAISAQTCRDLINKVSKHQDRLSRLFGLN